MDPAPLETSAADGGRRARRLLALGAAAGLVAAAVGLLRPGETARAPDPEQTVAEVNGVRVRREDYDRALQALSSDRKTPLDADDRRHVLDRLVDEELLVQRGLELGLAQRDRRVRGDLVSAVIDAVVSEAAVDEIPAAEVARFYDEHRDYFTRPGRHRVAVVWVRGEPGRADAEAVARAAEAARRLRAGEPFEDVRSALGDPEVAPVPDDLLPATKLREYLGTAALEIALALAPGEASDPVRTAGGYSVLLLRSREPDRTPPLPEIEPEVRAELRRRAGDGALARYLGELRERADVRIAEPAP